MTNENGEFSFKIPKKTDLKIVIDTGEGHRGEWTIAASEIEMPTAEKRSAMEKGLPAKNILIGVGCIFALAAIVALTRKRKMKS
jgi:nickel transport protein